LGPISLSYTTPYWGLGAGELALRALCVPVPVRVPSGGERGKNAAGKNGGSAQLAPGSGGIAAQLLHGQVCVRAKLWWKQQRECVQATAATAGTMILRPITTLHPHPLLPEGVVKLNGVLPVSK
jgi:hypothetical protein